MVFKYNYKGIFLIVTSNVIFPRNTAIPSLGQRVLAKTCAKISHATSGAAKWCLSQGLSMLKGATVWSVLQGGYSRGDNFELMRTTFLNPEQLRSTPVDLKFLEMFLLKKIDPAYREAGIRILDNFDLLVECPKKEYLRSFSRTFGIKITHQEIIKHNLLRWVVSTAFDQELIFRWLLQDVILKRCVKKAIRCISPQHASLVDSKIYTACRILIASLCFSASHHSNRTNLPDSYVDMQLYATFIMGIAFGILKETSGLAASIGAHAINNIVAIIPGTLAKC